MESLRVCRGSGCVFETRLQDLPGSGSKVLGGLSAPAGDVWSLSGTAPCGDSLQ